MFRLPVNWSLATPTKAFTNDSHWLLQCPPKPCYIQTQPFASSPLSMLFCFLQGFLRQITTKVFLPYNTCWIQRLIKCRNYLKFKFSLKKTKTKKIIQSRLRDRAGKYSTTACCTLHEAKRQFLYTFIFPVYLITLCCQTMASVSGFYTVGRETKRPESHACRGSHTQHFKILTRNSQ